MVVGNPNIKINSTMIDDFESPVSNSENASKYLKVNTNNKIDYIDINTLTDEVIATGKIPTSGGGSSIRPWTPLVPYQVGDIVIYDNGLFTCLEDNLEEEFDPTKWKQLSGYSKDKEFFYSSTESIDSITLSETISSKNNIMINVNNLLLQSNNYGLEDDNRTIRFYEPIEPDNNIEVTIFGNMELVRNVNNIVVKDYQLYSETTDFDLGERVPSKSLITINVNGKALQQSDWELINYGDTVRLNEPVSSDDKVEIKYFNDVELEIGGTYTPVVTKEGYETTLSWKNDSGLVNPDDVIIKDGINYVPQIEEKENETIISWINDQGAENPEPVSIFTNYAQRIVDSFVATEGQTVFETSHDIVAKSVLSVNVGNAELTSQAYELVDKKTVKLLNPLEEGDLVDIKYFYNLNMGSKGFTFTPKVTEDIQNDGYLLSWTNDGELVNPDTVLIENGHGLSIKGEYNPSQEYGKNDLVIFQTEDWNYGYIAKQYVPVGTPLTDTEYWIEGYKIAKYADNVIIKTWD